MSLEQKWQVFGWGHLFLITVFPVLIFWLFSATKARSLVLRIVITTLLTWFLRICYRIGIELPVNLERAAIRGDDQYDGVGGNVVVLILGWVEPLFVCLVAALVVKLRRKRRTPPCEPASS